MNNLKERYNHLVKLIRDNGTYFPKRHGNYVLLNYFDNYYFELDTWNSSISITSSDNIDDFGIKSNGYKTLKCIGIDWGGFELYVSEKILDFYIDNLRYKLGFIELHELMSRWEVY